MCAQVWSDSFTKNDTKNDLSAQLQYYK